MALSKDEDAVKHHTITVEPLQQRIIWPKVSLVLRMRNTCVNKLGGEVLWSSLRAIIYIQTVDIFYVFMKTLSLISLLVTTKFFLSLIKSRQRPHFWNGLKYSVIQTVLSSELSVLVALLHCQGLLFFSLEVLLRFYYRNLNKWSDTFL